MKQHMTASHLFILTVSGILGSLVGCSPEQTFSGPPIGNSQGGNNPDESSTATGGQQYTSMTQGGASTADTTAQGQGGAATGGAQGQGGNATGGAATSAATGGTKATTGGTGTKATGGTKASTGGTGTKTTGGTKATGGSKATGGAVSADGGADPTGGATAAGTTAATACALAGAITVVSPSTGQVSDGTCNGYAYAYASVSAKDTTGTATITPCTDSKKCATPETFADTDKLCASGSVGPSSDYNDVAGIGFNVNQSGSTIGTVATKGTGLQVSFTAGTKPTVLRVQIADSTGTNYCFDASKSTSPVKIPWASFNTECWEGATTAAKPFADTAFRSVQLVIPDPNPATTADTFTNLCLTGVTTY